MDVLDRAQLERDTAAAQSVLDADFALVRVQPEPSALTRLQWLDALPDDVIHDYEVVERFVHEDSDTASVLQLVRLSATVAGQDRSGQQAVTDVWRRRSDGWRLWRRHVTPTLEAEVETAQGVAARTAATGPGEGHDPAARATVTEVAAVLAAITDGGQDPASLSADDMEEYVEAFRALKRQGEPEPAGPQAQ